jgi:predicted metal-dependent phosphoesterase TrpH
MIDLHAHTSCSDGSLTPSELVALAAEIGLSAVAVTDHDSVEGIGEALAAGPRYGVEVVPGVEIPLEHERCTLDMLGYFLCGGPTDEFRERLERLRRDRDGRNEQILAKLAQLGYPLDPAELAEVADGEAVGRPHIGEALRRRGYVGSITEAFERFLRRGAPAFVDRRRLGLAEAVRLIGSSGGVPVIAHPGIIRTDAAGLERLVRDGVRLGVGGLECYYPLHDEETLRRCLDLAEKYQLVATGGSDFHGAMKPQSRLGQAYDGRPVPDSVLTALKALCERAGDGLRDERRRQ